jgi:hypothetical protein
VGDDAEDPRSEGRPPFKPVQTLQYRQPRLLDYLIGDGIGGRPAAGHAEHPGTVFGDQRPEGFFVTGAECIQGRQFTGPSFQVRRR